MGMGLQKYTETGLFALMASALLLSACGGGGGGGGGTGSASGPSLVSINMAPKNVTTALNARVQLAASATYSDNSVVDITKSASWSTNNASAVTVSATGLASPVVGAAAGQSAVISATAGGISASAVISLSALPTFTVATADPLSAQQWHLQNTGVNNGYADTTGTSNAAGTAGSDLNVNSVYSTYGYTGYGVTVGVVDTGMEIGHEDLKANVVPNGSWNFANNTTDPTNTISTTGDHGTMVSGLIGMARNGIGGIGVASNAQLEGFNFLSPAVTQTAAIEIMSLGGSAANPNSSNVFVFNQSFGTGNTVDFPMDPTVEAQYASGASTLRGGKGALYVKAAGNGFLNMCTNYPGISCQNANFDPSDTLPYNIVVGALNAKGVKTDYSTAGSAIWTSAPGGEFGMNLAAVNQIGAGPFIATAYDPAMVTTDQSGCLVGESVSTQNVTTGPFSFFNLGGANAGGANTNCNYTNGMNGTSSATPNTVGTIALILEAKPALTWRDVKDILAKSAQQVDAANPGVTITLGNGPYVAEMPWITNAAGFKFHNWYGFGAVNASAAVTMAKTYVSAMGTFANTGWIAGTVPAGAAATVPDNSTVGVSVPVTMPKVGTSGVVEAVQIQVTTSATGGWTGDLGIEVISPSGTRSILKNTHDAFAGNNLNGMVLESNAFYGETGTGTWTVKVVDGWAGSGLQTVTAVSMRVYGH